MWEERYASESYLFGRTPAQFLTRNRDFLVPGHKALAVADGEGRNSVYMAEMELDVTAFDYAPSAIDKARRLAGDKGVSVDFRLSDLESWDWAGQQFDDVFGIFIQFVMPDDRPAVFKNMTKAVRPGGHLFLHGYTPEQVTLKTGGPPAAEMMYTPELLEASFGDLEILKLETYYADLDEGAGHSGKSALIDFIARKPL